MTRRDQPVPSRSLRAWPLSIVVAGVLLGLLIAVIGANTWRIGCLVIGGSLGVGALIRIALPDKEAGLLQVRTRIFDIAVLSLCAVVIIVLTLVVPSGGR